MERKVSEVQCLWADKERLTWSCKLGKCGGFQFTDQIGKINSFPEKTNWESVYVRFRSRRDSKPGKVPKREFTEVALNFATCPT